MSSYLLLAVTVGRSLDKNEELRLVLLQATVESVVDGTRMDCRR